MNEKLSKILYHPLTIPISVGVVSFGIGVGTGYILARKKIEVYEIPEHTSFVLDEEDLAVLQEEAESVEIVITPSDDSSGVDISEKGKEFIKEIIEENLNNRPELDSEVITKNIFAGNDDDWNLEEEMKNRTPTAPYVIHKDEFFADEMGYTQHTITFYAGDEIMVDENSAPLYAHPSLTGPHRFGHGSGDPTVFYVRNDKNRAEYEVLLDEGHYSVEVMGLELEHEEEERDLKHSNIRKFRSD